MKQKRLSLPLLLVAVVMGGLVYGAPRLHAQVPEAPFTLVGHIETFTLDTPTDIFSSAKMTVNGIQVVIPRNTIVVLPAAYFTPQQLFRGPTQGPVSAQSGLALNDPSPPPVAFETTLMGNIINGTTYIAGLVYISQQSLNTSGGYIRQIDYTTGEMCVGLSPTPATTCVAPDTRVRLNDPLGRYGLADGPAKTSPDLRFTVDPDNPTIHAGTGYPMCVPRVAPPTVDPQCPVTNRPKDAGGHSLTTWVMSGPDIVPPIAGLPTIVSCDTLRQTCDPTQQAPFVVGDYIDFAGTFAENGTPTHPDYVSAHTINASVGIYTKQGVGNTVYISQETTFLGTGPINCSAAAECQAKIRMVGFTTDPSRVTSNLVNVYAIDVDRNGVRRTRNLLLGQSKKEGFFGRFRFDVAKNTGLTPDGKGATRELLVSIDDNGPMPDGTLVPDKLNAPSRLKANGLIVGQYVAPNFDYLFPETTLPGASLPPANLKCLAFLTAGWGIQNLETPSDTTLLNIPQLAPWPGATVPPASPAGITCSTF